MAIPLSGFFGRIKLQRNIIRKMKIMKIPKHKKKVKTMNMNKWKSFPLFIPVLSYEICFLKSSAAAP